MSTDTKKDTTIRVEIKNTSVTIDVRSWGKGLDLGQIERIETEFGVDAGDVQNMDFGNLSIKAMLAWIYGLLLPKVPGLTPDDVRRLDLEQVTGWFQKLIPDSGDAEEDEGPLEEAAGSGAPPTTSTPSAPSGGPGATPGSSGGHG